MSDKLQDVVERFLDVNRFHSDGAGMAIWEDDLRAFLAQVFPPGKYVLCEREPVAVMREWPHAVGLDFMVDCIGIHTPLYREAKEQLSRREN